MNNNTSSHDEYSLFDLENEIKKEIFVKDILPYPKSLINSFLRKLHYQEEALN